MFCKGRVGRRQSCNRWQPPPQKLPPQSALKREYQGWLLTFIPGVGRSSQGVVSAQALLQQALDCRAQASSDYVCYRLEGGGRVQTRTNLYFSKNSFRDLVHLVIASVAVLLASLVHHLDKFGWEPWVQILRSTKQMF